ncbi:MAG: hypothetical protein Q4D45_05460 [Lachnospiraceae bacterium]|nr:hypothetical protein [Lachnospiraceae bacterium]
MKKNILSGAFIKQRSGMDKWNLPVWDMHCHILPGVDDGAKNMTDALKMLELEMKEGINKILLTPHYLAGKTDPDLIKTQYQKLKYEIKIRNYPLELYLGNELFYSTSIIFELQKGRALTLAGTSYVLIEFETEISYQKMRKALNELLMAGYRPIIAHMERFTCLMSNKNRITELIRQGVLMQANTNSFIWHRTSNSLLQLLQHGNIHFIGTDCHRPDWRTPQMQITIKKIQTKLQTEEMIRIFVENPNQLLKNQYIRRKK